jgi:hypothetical protein
MSSDALILDLVTDLAPVKRRSRAREAAMLFALGAAELALFLGFGAMRPDMGNKIGSAYMLWRLGSLVLLAGVACWVAIRSFAPPASPRHGLRAVAALAGLAMIASAFVGSAADSHRSLLDRISPAQGVICAALIVVLALPVMAMLAVLMRRAAPVHPEASALTSGLAAGVCGALIFAFCCPMNDPLYVVVWYSVGTLAVAALARWLLPRRFRL